MLKSPIKKRYKHNLYNWTNSRCQTCNKAFTAREYAPIISARVQTNKPILPRPTLLLNYIWILSGILSTTTLGIFEDMLEIFSGTSCNFVLNCILPRTHAIIFTCTEIPGSPNSSYVLYKYKRIKHRIKNQGKESTSVCRIKNQESRNQESRIKTTIFWVFGTESSIK